MVAGKAIGREDDTRRLDITYGAACEDVILLVCTLAKHARDCCTLLPGCRDLDAIYFSFWRHACLTPRTHGQRPLHRRRPGCATMPQKD